MYDARRLRGPLAATAILAAALVLEGTALGPVVAGRPAWLPEADSTSNLLSFQLVASAIADELREDRAESAGRREGLGVLIGGSTLEWGVDPMRIPAGPGAPARWLRLTVIRANGRDVRHMGRLLLDAGFRPGLAVLALNPGAWARTDHALDDPTTPDFTALRRHIAAHNEFLAKREIEGFLLLPLNRILPNRQRIHRAAVDAMFDARIRLFAAMGHGLDSLFPTVSSFQRGNANDFLPDQAADPLLEVQMAGLRDRGLFDPASFSPDAPELRDLVRLVGEFRDVGSEVVLVVLPEMERLRALALPEPFRALDAALGRAFGASAPPVLDLRAAMPDEAFYDLTHCNPRGRAALSARLARALADLHAPHAP
jgi:hypothetical protein